jgi:hypothetical protein
MCHAAATVLARHLKATVLKRDSKICHEPRRKLRLLSLVLLLLLVVLLFLLLLLLFVDIAVAVSCWHYYCYRLR